METMILVAALAVAGLAGITAAFYFSLRPGSSRDRAGGPGRTGARRTAGSRRSHSSSARTGRAANSARSATTSRQAAGRTAPEPADFDQSARLGEDARRVAAGRPARHGTSPAGPRRAGWRKGLDVDEELWPAETFGGVTDEQFWDDMAADKPLERTARTAQADAGSRRRPPNAAPPPTAAPRPDEAQPPARRPGAEVSAGRYGASMPNGHGAASVPDGRGDDSAPDGGASVPDERRGTGLPGRADGSGAYALAEPSPTAAEPIRAPYPPAECGEPPHPSGGFGERRTLANEDPLTSPTYALRPKGPVGARSSEPSRPPREMTREQYDAAISQETQSFSVADIQAATGGYPDGHRPDPRRPDGSWRSSPIRSIKMPPGQMHGSGNLAGPAADPGPHGSWNGPRSDADTPGFGQAYPPGQGYQGPQAPWGSDPRLTGPHLPRAH
jgi:hypothetical protein